MKKNIDRYILLLIIIVLLGFLISYAIKTFQKEKKQEIVVNVVEKIDNYEYKLESTMSEEYKKLFNELKILLDNSNYDEQKYAELIAKMFILDFYTLNDKLSNTDIGGIDFVHTIIQDNFKLKATDTFYKYVENNIYGTRKEELSIAKDVKIKNIKNISYTYNSVVDKKAYEIQLNWDYKKDFGYEKEKTLYFVHENDKLSLVEMK